MAKVKVTYTAPKGDNKVVETRGLTLFDGQTVELDEDEHETFLEKAKGNPHFMVGDQHNEQQPDKPGKADLKAGIEEARDHDFEADRREGNVTDQYDGMKIDDLRAEADKRAISHDGLSKAQLREALRKQ